ncbi:hypothetical protein TNCV_1962381 [Trichonephila clavipes]|nr:hypothetical protein TNCV_1962381 [Trichonephila clavipes]
MANAEQIKRIGQDVKNILQYMGVSPSCSSLPSIQHFPGNKNIVQQQQQQKSRHLRKQKLANDTRLILYKINAPPLPFFWVSRRLPSLFAIHSEQKRAVARHQSYFRSRKPRIPRFRTSSTNWSERTDVPEQPKPNSPSRIIAGDDNIVEFSDLFREAIH